MTSEYMQCAASLSGLKNFQQLLKQSPFVWGDNYDNIIHGNVEGGILSGNEGNDVLLGVKGRDFLFGGTGNDVIVSFGNGDIIVGGEGGDIFKFEALDGLTIITDFNPVGDFIDLSTLNIVYDNLRIFQTELGAIIYADGGWLLLTEYDASRISENDFVLSSAPGVVDLYNLDAEDGFVIQGERFDDRAGYDVGSAGDINGDGIDDIIIGARYADVNGNKNAGKSYVIFGSEEGFQSSLSLTELDGSNGFVIFDTQNLGNFGRSVNGAGDVNGDGYDDLIVSTYTTGEVYIVYGSGQGFEATLDVATLDGTNGFTFVGSGSDNTGSSVNAAGDVNGDGIDDLLIGSPFAPSGGYSVVVFGSSQGFDALLSISEIDGTNGFIMEGDKSGDYSGSSVASVGDVNGDGLDDIIIGAYSADSNGQEASGAAYVVFGSQDGFDQTLQLSALDGEDGFILQGSDYGERAGYSVSGIGDFNGDSLDDFIIGAYGVGDTSAPSAGKSYVIFGSESGFDSTVDLSSLDGVNGIILSGESGEDWSGYSVSAAGDVNGDGLDDVLIGAPYADHNNQSGAGEAYIVFGSTETFDPNLNLSELDGTDGIIFRGVFDGDQTGFAVSAAGDINDDGYDDILIAAPTSWPDGKAGAGQVYVVYGGETIVTSLSPLPMSDEFDF